MKRIGILTHGFIEWGGGVDFLRLIAASLVAADPAVELHFLIPTSGPRFRTKQLLRHVKHVLYMMLGRSYAKPKRPDFRHVAELVKNTPGHVYMHVIDLGMGAIRRASQEHHLDVLLPALSPLRGQTIPWIGYLFDYQHAYYPQFFAAGEVARREVQFKAMLQAASQVIVNAQTVADDIDRFNPDHRAKIIPLPFSAAPNPQWFDLELTDAKKYGITRPYFIICNQFWQHKDHLTAWQGFAILLSRCPETELVCTGEPHDYRNPGHFAGLTEAAAQLGISHRLKVLGLIPKADQISLLRGAVAVIQPSLFEGGPGGGAVFDAVSLGVPAIVSDVPVNRELNEPNVEFFEARNAASLAERMELALSAYSAHVRSSPEALLVLGAQRRQRCGRVLLDAISAAIKPHTNAG